MLERGETTLLDDIELWDGWNEEEEEYFNKKLEDLTEKTIELKGGCLRHYRSTDEKWQQTVDCNIKHFGRSKNLKCYRFVALSVFGLPTLDLIVRHKCRTKGCYNPNHIELGTNYDNSMDQFRDGTINNILEEEEVMKIYDNPEGYSTTELMDKYGVSRSAINYIRSGQTWGHITGLAKKEKHINKDECKKYILENKEIYLEKLRKNIEIDENGCWNWLGCLNEYGYGKTSAKNINTSSHVLSWSLANGRFPSEKEVIRHMCNNNKNKSCCNPDHLLIGSHSDNMKDRKLKGEKTNATLNEEEVIKIASLLGKETTNVIADEFNVSESAIKNIKYGKTWKDITNVENKRKSVKYARQTVTEEEAIEIINMIKTTDIGDIADKFGVSEKVINNIKKGRNWAHISGINYNYEGKNPENKLTEEDVINIVKLSETYSQADISKQTGLHNSTISGILTGKTHSNVTGIKSKKKIIIKDYTDATIANIKYILKLDLYVIVEIARQFNVRRILVEDVFREKRYKDILPKLDSDGENILKILENKSKEGDSVLKTDFRTSDEDVGDIKFLLNMEKFKHKEIAEIYNVSPTIIGKIFRKENFTHIRIPNELSKNGLKKLKKLEKIISSSDSSEKRIIKTEISKNVDRLTGEMVADIKYLIYRGKCNDVEIAEMYDSKRSTIARIRRDETYKSIKRSDKLSEDGEERLKKL